MIFHLMLRAPLLIQLLTVLVGSWTSAAGAAAPPEPVNPFLRILAEAVPNGVAVVHGGDASSREAAQLIGEAIRRIPGQQRWAGLVSAVEFEAANRSTTGQVHVIAVGTLHDNVVMQNRGWLPTWWIDRDWYYQKYPFAVKPEDALAYQPISGFACAGFGEWPKEEKRIGYIEVERSDYMMEWLVRERWDKLAGKAVSDDPRAGEEKHAWRKLPENSSAATYPRDFPLRLMIRVTGSGPEGVKAAAKAFASEGMLSGVVFAAGAKADTGPELFTLSAARYTVSLPFVPPPVVADWTYIGWLEPDAFFYDGLLNDAGVKPERAIRFKYVPKSGITGFWSTPHRRAGSMEIVGLKFSGSGEAEKAWQHLRSGLDALAASKDGKISGVNAMLVHDVLYIESLPEPAGGELLTAFRGLKPW